MTSERDDQITDHLTTGTAAVQSVGASLGRKADRSDVWRVAIVAGLVAITVSVGVAVPVAVSSSAANARQEATLAANEAAAVRSQKRADQAFESAQAANEELRRRGAPTVPVPKPTGDNVLDSIVAATVPQVLALLPDLTRAPTQEELGLAVARYLSTNPVPGPSAFQVAQAVAGYLADNPPPAGPQGAPGATGQPGQPGAQGPQGPQGERGPTPTTADIMAAFSEAVRADPSLLCAGQGTFVLVRGVITQPDPDNPLNQVVRDIWTCEPSGS